MWLPKIIAFYIDNPHPSVGGGGAHPQLPSWGRVQVACTALPRFPRPWPWFVPRGPYPYCGPWFVPRGHNRSHGPWSILRGSDPSRGSWSVPRELIRPAGALIHLAGPCFVLQGPDSSCGTLIRPVVSRFVSQGLIRPCVALIRPVGLDSSCGALVWPAGPCSVQRVLIHPAGPRSVQRGTDSLCGALIRPAGPWLVPERPWSGTEPRNWYRGTQQCPSSWAQLIHEARLCFGGAKYVLALGDLPFGGPWPEWPPWERHWDLHSQLC